MPGFEYLASTQVYSTDHTIQIKSYLPPRERQTSNAAQHIRHLVRCWIPTLNPNDISQPLRPGGGISADYPSRLTTRDKLYQVAGAMDARLRSWMRLHTPALTGCGEAKTPDAIRSTRAREQNRTETAEKCEDYSTRPGLRKRKRRRGGKVKQGHGGRD
jgi:hypothetical protein